MTAALVTYHGRPGIDVDVDVQPVPGLAPFTRGEARVIDDSTAASVAAANDRRYHRVQKSGDGADATETYVPDGLLFAQFVFGLMNQNRKPPLFTIEEVPAGGKKAATAREGHSAIKQGTARYPAVVELVPPSTAESEDQTVGGRPEDTTTTGEK